MTFEEFTQHFPDICHGCIMIKLTYDGRTVYASEPTDVDALCSFVQRVDKCPCPDCLVKMRCLNSCEIFEKLHEKYITGEYGHGGEK